VRILVLLIAFCSVARADTVLVVDQAMSAAKRAMVREATDGMDVKTVPYKRLAQGLATAAKSLPSRVVVITDGDSTIGIAATIAKLGLSVSAIGIESMNDRALKTIANAGKGRVYKVEDATALAATIRKEADIPPPEPETFAYVFVIDRSTSMQGPKFEIVKEITRVGLEVASPLDTVAVIAFDDTATIVVRPQRATNRPRMSTEISRLRTGGSTNLAAGLAFVEDTLKSIKATETRVIVGTRRVSDAAIEVAKRIAAPHVTLSAIGMGDKEIDTDLKGLATAGGGEVIEPDKAAAFFVRAD
jgi:Mg-chelatase subunit ChlD